MCQMDIGSDGMDTGHARHVGHEAWSLPGQMYTKSWTYPPVSMNDTRSGERRALRTLI